MQIIQKKSMNKTGFEFGEKKFKHTIKDLGGSRSFFIDYGEISRDMGEIEENDLWIKNLSVVMAVLGIAMLIVSRLEDIDTYTSGLIGTILLTMGTIYFLVNLRAKTVYTTIDTEKGCVYIIKDKQHDKILEEIFSRRKKQFLKIHGEVNFLNDPNDEINKFKWLRNEEMISENELNQFISTIQDYHNKKKELDGHPDGDKSIN